MERGVLNNRKKRSMMESDDSTEIAVISIWLKNSDSCVKLKPFLYVGAGHSLFLPNNHKRTVDYNHLLTSK